MARTDILFPPGRLVGGSLYKPREKRDKAGKPVLHPVGHARAGQPKTEYLAVYAIPKNPGEQAWWQTAWGQQVTQVGATGHPASYQHRDFSWKIKDGDSQEPNKKNRKPCDNEGWPGHWVVIFSSTIAPSIYTQAGGKARPLTEDGAVKVGYWVQIQGNVSPNTGDSPGVYMNPNMVMFLAYGAEIRQGPDPDEVGFVAPGAFALPPGASLTPQAGVGMPAALPAAAPSLPTTTPPAPPAPPALGVPAGTTFTPVTPPPAVAPAPTVVVPHVGFLAGPATAPAAPVPPAPPAPAAPAAPVRTMTAAAGGVPYQAYIDKGWTDALLVSHGLMLP